MAPKPIKRALRETLENVSNRNFERFCFELQNREEDPRIRLSQVEGKDRLDIINVMVSTFTALGALQEAVKILRVIDCNEEANMLVKETSEGSSDNGQFGEAGAAGSSTVKEEEWRIVEKLRSELIDRVTNVSQILDKLLEAEIIDQECYNRIFKMSPRQDQMREIYERLQSERAKKTFYIVLKEKEPHLMDELMRK